MNMTTNFDDIIDRTNTDSIKYDRAFKELGNENLIPMWVADMDFASPDFIFDAIKERCEKKILGYSSIPERWNNAISSWLNKRYDWIVENDEIGFVPGIVSGIGLAIQCFSKPGDKILIQSPVYPPFIDLPHKNERELLINKLKLVNGIYEIDFEDFEEKISSGCKIFIFCSPHNPGGRVWKKEEIKRISEICVRYGVLIISDEIHADLTLPGFHHTPTASINDDISNNVITLMAPSKTFNIPGLSSSFFVCKNEGLRNKFQKYMDLAELNHGNIFAITAAIAAYENGEHWLNSLTEYLQKNIDYVKDFLSANIPEIKPVIPQASYLIWLDCKDLNLSDNDLKKLFLNKAKLILNPGTTFGPGGEGFMRINIGCPMSTIVKAMSRLKSALS